MLCFGHAVFVRPAPLAPSADTRNPNLEKELSMNTLPRTVALYASVVLIVGASSLTVGAQTLKIPKLSDCRSQCIAKATQAWADAAEKCDGLPPGSKELQKCAQNAEKVFDKTLKDCQRACSHGK
jgi:hypothetical protein